VAIGVENSGAARVELIIKSCSVGVVVESAKQEADKGEK